MSVVLNGTSQYLQGPDSHTANFEKTDSWSCAMWQYQTTAAFTDMWTTRDATPTGWVWGMNNNPPLKMGFALLASGADLFDTTSNITINTNQWYHLGVTYNGANAASGVVYYINGVADPATAASGTSVTGSIRNSNVLRLGANNGTSRFLPGNVVDAALWTGVLTAAEMRALATSGCRPPDIRPQALRAYLPLTGPNQFANQASFGRSPFFAPVAGPGYSAADPGNIFLPGRRRIILPSPLHGTFLSTRFRKTFSPIGTRTGDRQTWAA